MLYVHEESVHNTKAAEAFVPFLLEIIKPNSVLDVGCGNGTWLSVLKKHGATRVIGIDGDYVDKEKLYIDQESFIAYDLKNAISLKEKFDLVICLEVAEHLPYDCAETIVKTLINHSEVILFSAALTKQGGQNHLNEQSFSFWVNVFKKYGYSFIDAFRSKIWNIDEIDVWYRQNMFLVVKDGHHIFEKYSKSDILDFYHPLIYLGVVKKQEYWQSQYESLIKGEKGVINSLKILAKSIKNSLGS